MQPLRSAGLARRLAPLSRQLSRTPHTADERVVTNLERSVAGACDAGCGARGCAERWLPYVNERVAPVLARLVSAMAERW